MINRYLAYTIAVLIVLLGGAGLLLKRAWAENAVHKAEVADFKQTIGAWAVHYDSLQRVHVIQQQKIVEGEREKREIRNALSRAERTIEELRRHDPETESWFARCDLPPALYECLREPDCDPEARGEGAPPERRAPRADARSNARRPVR